MYNYELGEAFRFAAQAGFDGVELMVTKNAETQSAEYLKRLTERYSLPIKSIHAPFLMAARKVWGGPRGKIERTVWMGRELGSEVVVVHLPYFWQMGYARWAHHNLNAYNRKSDVIVAMENAMMVNLIRPVNLSFFNTLSELKHFEHLVMDTSHLGIAGIDIIEAWEELKVNVSHIHLSNNYLKGFDDHALPYEGHLPLDRFLGRLRRDGYGGLVVLELGPGPLEARLGGERVTENLKRSLEFCRENYLNFPA